MSNVERLLSLAPTVGYAPGDAGEAHATAFTRVRDQDIVPTLVAVGKSEDGERLNAS